MVANAAMLNKTDVVQYIGANANKYGLDPAAMLAVANHEGLNTTPGSTWVLPREAGFNFGPPSWYSGGAGSNIVAMQGNQAAAWSWTPAGLDYWMQKVAEAGAGGRTGLDAITAIVQRFERPREDLAAGEITNAWRDYQSFQAQIAGSGIPAPIPGLPPLPGQIPGQTGPGQLPIPGNPQKPAPAPSTSSSNFSIPILVLPDGKKINFTLPWDLSGILLFLAAIFAIIIGALLWDKSRNVIVKTTETAAIAA